MEKLMSKFKYRDTVGGLLIAAVLLCGYRAIHYLVNCISGFSQYFGSRQNIYDYDYSGGMIPYLDEMSYYTVDITEVIAQLVLAAAIPCLGAAALLVLLKGTEKPLLPALLCLPGLGVLAAMTLQRLTQFAFVYELPLGIILYGLIAAGLITVMVWLPKNMNIRRNHILWLLLGILVLVLVVNDVYSSSAVPFSALDGLAAVLAVSGIVEAVRHDDHGEPVIEEDDGEEECEECAEEQ